MLFTDIRLLDVTTLFQVVDLRHPGFRIDDAVTEDALLLVEPEFGGAALFRSGW